MNTMNSAAVRVPGDLMVDHLVMIYSGGWVCRGWYSGRIIRATESEVTVEFQTRWGTRQATAARELVLPFATGLYPARSRAGTTPPAELAADLWAELAVAQ